MTHQTYLVQTGPDEGEIRCYQCNWRQAVQMMDGRPLVESKTILIREGDTSVGHGFVWVDPKNEGAL